MNEEAIKDAYNLFVGTGYKKSYEEFKQLIASNPEALNDAYGLFVKTGYTKDINSFKTLMGVGGGTAQPQEDLKKKEESVTTGSPSDDSSSASQKPIKYDFTNLGKPKDPNEALGIKQVKDVDFAAIAQKEKEREAQKPEFYRSLEKDINPSLMQKTEEVVVPEMQYKFGPLGFKFEEWDPGSNTMRVTAPDGKSQEYVRLKDNDPEEMRKLQRFIDENTNVPGLKSLEKQYAEENKKFNTDEEVSAALKSVTDRVTVLNKDVTGFLGEKKLLDEEKELIESVPAVDRNTPQYKQRLAEYNAKATALETKMKDIVFREEQIKADAVKLEKAVGKYTSMKAEQGSWPGGLLDSFMRGIGKISAGGVNAGIDVMFSKYTLGVDEDTISSEVSESKATGDPLQDAKEGGVAVSNAYRINEIYNRATEEQRAKGVEEKYMTVPVGTPSPIPMPSAGQSYKDWWNSLSPDQREAIVDKSNDDIKKDLKVNLLPAMRTGAEIVMGDPNTTVQWADLKKQGFWGGAILGVTESLPAMIGANTTMGWAQRTAAMYAQTTDAVYEEMSKNPAFDDISESEKLSVLAPIGITGAVLESIGLRNLVSNKGLMNRIILGAVGRAGATTTAKTFGELVENEVDSMIARGLITASGAMLAEAETGAAQQISEYAYKEIYNAVKGKDMFQTPDFLSAEYIKDVAVAGAQEAVGGFVLGVPSAVSAAYQKKGFLSMDDAQFEFFRAAANDEKIESAYVAKLKQNVVTGKTTIKEAKEALNNYRNSVGLYRSVPEELSTQDAKEAMNLLREKRELEKQKEGKDEALVKRQTNRITEINSRLEELSSRSTEDATAPETPSAPSGNRIQVLTDEEEERRLSLEQAVSNAMLGAPDGLDPLSVLIDGGLMSFQDAQQELQTLNEKANAVQESSAESVLSREQGETAEAGGERGQMGQGVQGQEVTQEGRQEKVGILSSPETITVALEQLPQEERTATTFMQEDGTETPVMGNEKMLADLYSAASQVAEQDRTSGQQSVINAVEVSLRTQLDNEVEQARIEQERSMEGMKAARPQVARTKKTVVSNVIKSMRSVFPDLKISTHRNAGDMRDYAQRTFGDEISSQVLGDEGGMIVYDANNKPIAILVNDEISDATTMPHEAWHGILIKAFGRNEQLFAKFRDAIKKRLVDNGFSEISDQLDEFSQTEEYAQSDSQAEEWMAQLGGLLTASGITPDNLTPAAKTLLGQIKEVFNSIAEKITGSRIFLEDATPDDVLDFMVAISDRMRRGESVSDFFKSDTQQETGRAAKTSKQTKWSPISEATPEYVKNNILPYVVNVYKIQDKGAERILERSFKPNRVWVYKIENAGDIIRELSKYKNTFLDPSYIYEKVNKLESFLKSQENQSQVSPDDSYYQFKRQNEDSINDFIKAYEDLPVVSEAQSVAKKMVLDLLNGDIKEAQKGIDYFNEIRKAKDIKKELMSRNEYDILGEYQKAKEDGTNPDLVLAVESIPKKSVSSSKQKASSSATLEQIQKISKRYNVNNDGFAPKQVDERALSRELAPFGYSAKRAKVTADGYGGGVYIVDSRGRVFNPFRTSKQRASSAARLQTGVESIAGYDRMMSEIDGIIAKSKSRGRSKSETAKNVMEYMMGSAVYEKATDVQRDQMVRDINERFGISMKSAPSVGKLFGTIKDVKKITMSEKQLLKKQIRDLARGAKDAKVAAAKITDMLTRSIKAMSLSGSITNKQVSSVIRRFGKVNVFSQESIDKFVEYMANVFEDANYDEKISAARKLSKKAKANIKTKIGASDSIASDLRKLFSINPLLIPAKVMDRYMELLESFGASSAVLSLENINEVKDALSNILKAINNEVSAVASLSSRFEYYEDKVFTKDGKLLYTETIDQMLEQGVITKEDYDLMSKYRSEISPAERESMTEEEIEAAKKEVIQGILSERIDPRELSLDDEVNLARKISQLLDRYLLEKMTLNQLKNLEKLIGVINNGYMPGAAQVLYQELLSTKESLVLDEAVSEAKPLSLTKMYSNLKSKLTRKDATLEMIRRNPLFFIDQLFGDFKTKRIFDSVFSRLAQAQSAFESSIGRVNKRLDIAHDEVAKSFGYKANETIMSSFKMMTYMLQLEYETNPESNQVNPAAAYLKETIKYLESKGTKVSNREADMLREILKHYSSYGEIDAKKLYQSFNSAEKKAIAEVQDINKSLEEKASYTAAVIRGKRIDPLNNYIHHFSRGAFSSDDNASATELANIYNASMNPSTKAMNLMERQKKPTPISFDLFASAQRGAKFTLLDYHMTEPLRVAKMTVNKTSKMIESNDGTDLQKQVINAVSAALSESASNVLINNFVSDSLTEMIINYISKQGYRAVLASAPRFVAELSSNIAFATIVDPKSFSEGVKYKDIIMSPLAVMVMDNVKSKSTTRLFHGDTLSGRFIDRSILSQSSGVKSAKPVSVAEEKANMIYNMSLKKYKNFVELVSDALISTPDKMVMRPIWFGSFATEFKRQTGKDVDFNKIAEADSDYMNDNAEAIESAREYADGRSVMAGASDNAFMGILKGTVKPDQGAFVRAFNNFNNFMTRFTIYEYITARQGLYAAMGDGSISRKEGVAMVAGVTTRMTVYTLLSGILGNAMLSMFADEEEDDEKTFMQKFSQALSSAMVSLVVGRDFGNATKSILNYGVEELNEEFLTGLRNGDYDPYKDAISFSVIPRDKGDQRFDAADLMARMSGSFGPTVKTSVLMMKKMSEPEKKEADAIARSEDEKNIRIPLEVLGNAGLVPLYKDIRKIVMKEMYKELENADKKAADKKQAEKEMLHGYENKTEMKRYNPELYEEVFGEGSPGYNEAQAKKNIKKEKEKLERQMKDDFYNYQPNKKSSNAFGSKDFGKGKDKESKSFGSKKFGE